MAVPRVCSSSRIVSGGETDNNGKDLACGANAQKVYGGAREEEENG